MKTFTDYREGTIKLYNTMTEYMKQGKKLEDLEKMMLIAYQLSKYLREKELLSDSNHKITGIEQPIDKAIMRCISFLERNDVDPLVKANLLEVLSRSAFRILKKNRY